VTTFATGSREETLRVVVTGTFSGESDLHEALDDSGSGLDVVAWAPEVLDAVPYLGADDVHAVLLGAGRDGEPVMAMLETDVAVIRLHTQAPIVLLVPEAHPGLVETAFTAGVDDVLVLPQLAETISFAIRKAHETGGRSGAHGPYDRDVPRGRVVTVFSPKGGTGKTVLSTNLAALLAHKSGKRVLLIDLDLQFGDAAIMLGLDPERTMHDLVQAPGGLDAGKLAGYTTRHRSGLDVLAAPMRPEDAELVTESKVLQMLEVARGAYDLVIVDTSPFFYGPMLAVLRQTDQMLMLCGLDVPTLKNVKLSLRTLEMLGFPASRTSLVLNRVTPKVGLTKDDVEGVLGLGVSFEIPNDPVVAPAVNSGAVAALVHGDSEFSQAVALIAQSFERAVVTATTRAAEAPKRRWLAPRRVLEGRAS
jgi:pilus assembly protein CpaE